MALTISNVVRTILGDRRVCSADVVLGTYATDGVALVASDFQMSRIDILLAAPNGGVMPEYDHANGKMKAYYPLAAHTHVFAGDALGTHGHAFTGSALGTHGHAFTGSALGAHTHDLKVVGGAAAAGTKELQALASVLSKEEAADATLAGGTNNIQSITAGTPAGSNAVASAGTPAGTNAAASAGTPAGTNANNTAAGAGQVGNGVSLAAITFRVFVIGN